MYTEFECEGHESLRGDEMGVTVYCDGTCRIDQMDSNPTCLWCSHVEGKPADCTCISECGYPNCNNYA